MEITFRFEKETKNTVQFKEIHDDPALGVAIGTLYVQKSALESLGYKAPGNIKVALSKEE